MAPLESIPCHDSTKYVLVCEEWCKFFPVLNFPDSASHGEEHDQCGPPVASSSDHLGGQDTGARSRKRIAKENLADLEAKSAKERLTVYNVEIFWKFSVELICSCVSFPVWKPVQSPLAGSSIHQISQEVAAVACPELCLLVFVQQSL